MKLDENIKSFELVFESASFNGDDNISATYLSDFLRQFIILHVISSQHDISINLAKISKKAILAGKNKTIRNLSMHLSKRNPKLSEGDSYYSNKLLSINIQEEIDLLYHDLFSGFSLINGKDRTPLNVPVIESISFNSPFTVKLSGTAKALVLTVAVCGGTIDFSEGKVELPGLISVVEKINEIIKDHLESEYESSQASNDYLAIKNSEILGLGSDIGLPNIGLPKLDEEE